jgi:hypothetical protein
VIEFYAIRTSKGITPEFAMDADKFEDVPFGKRIKVSVSFPRNRKRDGLYWAVLREVCRATDRWPSDKHLHEDLLITLGFWVKVVSLAGEVRLMRDSTAHDKMTDPEFAAYFTRAMALLAQEIGYDPLAEYEAKYGKARAA